MTIPHWLRRGTPIVAVCLSSFLAGCEGTEPDPREAFENLRIQVAVLDGREAQLRDRRAELPEEGVELILDDLHLTGILEFAARPVTTGILYVIGEGSGSSAEVLVAVQEDGRMSYAASHPLGERLRVEGIRYQEGTIVLHLLEPAPDDPPCCPSRGVQRRFSLEGDRLLELPSDPLPE